MREPMSNVDAAWYRMDRPENTADVVMLLTFDSLPPFSRVRQLVEERLLPWPRFRQRVVRGSLLSGDVWEDDPAFALDHHLVRRRVRTRDPSALRDLVGAIATESLDPRRPLWRVYLVELPSGGALVAKIHHCLGDGFALGSLFLGMADERAQVPEPSPVAVAAFRRLEPWLEIGKTMRATLLHPVRAAMLGLEAIGLATALVRMAALSHDPPTILSRALTGRRRAAWSSGLSLARVKEAARARGATVNDMILAAVTGALRGYLAAAGERIDGISIRAMVPVNLRIGPAQPRPDEVGNRFGLVYLDLPTDIATPQGRLDAVRQRTAIAKARPDAVVSYGVLGAIGLVPAVAPWACRFFSGKASVVITNVPSSPRHLHWSRHRVANAMFWVPHPSTLGVGISVLTYGGEVRIGVRADEAVMTDPGDLVTRFERELAALGVTPPARPRASGWRATLAPTATASRGASGAPASRGAPATASVSVPPARHDRAFGTRSP